MREMRVSDLRGEGVRVRLGFRRWRRGVVCRIILRRRRTRVRMVVRLMEALRSRGLGGAERWLGVILVRLGISFDVC